MLEDFVVATVIVDPVNLVAQAQELRELLADMKYMFKTLIF